MYSGALVFSQVISHLPMHRFHRCVSRYRGNHKVKRFSCRDQFLCMAFAQLTYRESLRDIEACLRAQKSKLYHMGIRGNVARNTLANANRVRDWKIYADFAQLLIQQARALYSSEPLSVDLDQSVYALDSTTVDLCLSTFPWAKFRRAKAAVKLHTLLDLQGSIPTFIHVTDGKVHDVQILDELIPNPGAYYVMDRAYLDFHRLYTLHQCPAFFVTRAKTNLQYRRLYSRPVDKNTGLRCDQTIRLTGPLSSLKYPENLRRIKFYDVQNDATMVFLTNNFSLSAINIADLYHHRWRIELFFKWIKQHLRIKRFYGTSENAVKTQIWIAVSVYVLVAIIKKRLNLEISLYTILQILSITIFERSSLLQVLTDNEYKEEITSDQKQLKLFT